MPLRICWGIWAKEITQENAEPAATRMNTTAVISPVDRAMLDRSESLTRRKISTSRISA
ncbi:hypothetical protein D3C80_2140500 [compost metagenome]